MQAYAEEEKGLWEDFRHGLMVGTMDFVDRIKSRYVTVKPHREVSQQTGMVGRIEAEEYLRRASALLGRDLNRFRQTGRLYGEEREDRESWRISFGREEHLQMMRSERFSGSAIRR